MKLNKKVIDALEATGSDCVVWDDDLIGFGLRINPGGKRSFIIQYRDKRGSSKRHTIGRYGTLTPDEARKAAARLLAKATLGEDLAAEPKERKALTVAELHAEYFKAAREGHYLTHYRDRPIKQSTLDIDEPRSLRHIVRLLGAKRVRELTTDDVRKFVADVKNLKDKNPIVIKTKARGKAVVSGGEGAARRVTARLSAMLNYAIRAGHLPSGTANVCSPVKFGKKKRRAIYISQEDYGRIGAKLTACNHATVRNIATLIALTGLRKNEALKLRWSEVDLHRKFILLDDSKTGPSDRPLGDCTVNFLKSLRRAEDAIYVFPSPNSNNRPFNSFEKAFNALETGYTVHAFRHGIGSLADELGLSRTMIANLLGHVTFRNTTEGYIEIPRRNILEAANKVQGYIWDAMFISAVANDNDNRCSNDEGQYCGVHRTF